MRHDITVVQLNALRQKKGSDLSIKLLSAVWALSLGNSTDKLVLAALADYASDDGRCFPSIASLSKRTELSQRAIYESLKRLKEKGYLEVIHRHRHSNVFQLTLPAPTAVKEDSDLRQAQVPLRLAQVIPAPSAGVPAPSAVRTVKDPSSESSPNLRARSRYSDVGELAELRAWAKDVSFREIERTESIADYRRALKDYVEFCAGSTVTNLKAEMEKRRSKL